MSEAKTAAIKLAPSILTADMGVLADQIRAAEAGGADYIHLDVMDGHFVPPITLGPLVVEAVRRATKLPLDIHLMIEHPERQFEAFAEAGATSSTSTSRRRGTATDSCAASTRCGSGRASA